MLCLIHCKAWLSHAHKPKNSRTASARLAPENKLSSCTISTPIHDWVCLLWVYVSSSIAFWATYCSSWNERHGIGRSGCGGKASLRLSPCSLSFPALFKHNYPTIANYWYVLHWIERLHRQRQRRLPPRNRASFVFSDHEITTMSDHSCVLWPLVAFVWVLAYALLSLFANVLTTFQDRSLIEITIQDYTHICTRLFVRR